MFRYETHCHTSPVSKCAVASVEETVAFYASLGYDGLFITNHFIDGNCAYDDAANYEAKIRFYFSDYEKALGLSEKYGIKIFGGIEMSYRGTDFLVYGLDKDWFLKHSEIYGMDKITEMKLMASEGGLVIQAHPFREARYIDHIRLYPRSVQGIETLNACRTELENKMADIYAEQYGFIKTAGTDNHFAGAQKKLAGIETDEPINSEKQFIEVLKSGSYRIFELENNI